VRDVTFKGKRVDNGNWIEGYFFRIWEKTYILWGTTNGVPNMIEVIPESVNQFTGRLDRTGVKIFENDIVKGHMDFGPAGWLERVARIYWHNECGYQWNYFLLDTIEVIGNAYDNPELLEEKNNG
jgi:hypothetical protein